jgi:hypothetical protein
MFGTKFKIRHTLSAVIVLTVLIHFSCEKDDICVDGDTPLLILTFFKSENPESPIAINKLRVIGIENNAAVNTFSDRSNRDSIALPLRNDQNLTGFVFIQNSANDESGIEIGNADTLYVNYSIESVYISRACGFIPIYDNLNITRVTDNNNWIDSLNITTTRIANSTASHVSVFF